MKEYHDFFLSMQLYNFGINNMCKKQCKSF